MVFKADNFSIELGCISMKTILWIFIINTTFPKQEYHENLVLR